MYFKTLYKLYRQGRPKTLLIMRLTAILLLAGCMTASAAAYSQTITIRARNISLEKVFREIKKQSGYSFVYRDNWIKEAAKVDLQLKDVSVGNALDSCFRDQPLTYAIVDKTIVVRLKQHSQVHREMQEFLPPQITVNGTVKDQQGRPLVGVTVSLKGTQTATVTNAGGNYSIILPDENGVLVFSYIGYSKVEKPVNRRSEMDVVMSKSISALNELVTVGYGVQKKVDVTGAVSQISGQEIANRPVSNLEQALQGAIPGLNFLASKNTGQPGGTYSVNIRGLASLANAKGNASYTQGMPYILVDGVPMDLNDVDPNNIESISVLKDAASSAIYGARAAYGVILITTKSGKKTPGLKVSYSYNYAMAQPTKFVHSVDALTYALAIDSAAANAGASTLPYATEVVERIKQYMKDPEHTPAVYPNAAGIGWDFEAVGYGANANTDWYDALFRKNAIRQTHNINISGSGRNVSYALSAGLFHEDGVSRYANDQYNRKTLSGQLNAQPLPWLKAGLVTKYVGSEAHNPNTKIVNRLAPTLPLHNPLGGYFLNSNIPQTIAQTTASNAAKWVLSPSVQIEPIRDWVTTVRYNYIYTGTTGSVANGTSYELEPDSTRKGTNQNGTNYSASMARTIYESPTLTSTYHRQIGDHYIAALVGFQEELETVFGLNGRNTYLLTDNVPSIATAVGVKSVDDNKSHWATQSIFGRLNYNYKDKYLFEANVRRDGSSRFAPGNRWGTFPSVSIGYNIAKEKFFPFKDQITMMKVRFSWGSIGNQNVADYLYVPVMGTGQGTYLFSDRPYTVNPPSETTTGLSWEKVNTKDIGLDMYVFDNKLSITADWYQSDNMNLVGPGVVVPEIYGGSVPKANNGTLRTRGWEVQVNWRQSLGGGFSYFANFNLSDYHSVVTSYNNPLKLLSTFYEGEVMGTIWGYKTDGLYQSAEEVAKRGVDQSLFYKGTWAPGDVKYRDLDGDGVITQGEKKADDHGDMTIIGNSTARYHYGLYAGAGYKGFDLSFRIQGVAKWVQWPGAGGQSSYWGPTAGPGLGAVVLEGQQDFWRYDNKGAFWPRPYRVANSNPRQNMNKATSDRYLQNRAYVRLKALQVGYSFPASLVAKIRASQLRVYFSGDNLFTDTKYRLFDPEVGGYDNSYPLQKVFSFGVNVTF
jgi:TonB-linked SusC/RagA family outer membrane protein